MMSRYFDSAARLRHYRKRAWENAAKLAVVTADTANPSPWAAATYPTDWRIIARAALRRAATPAGLGAAGDDGGQWSENPAALGLRWVGWADEVLRHRLYTRDLHCGWYTDSDGDRDVIRGCVWQLPGRKGQARYIPGYREGSNGRSGWADTATGDDSTRPTRLYFGDIVTGPGNDSDYLACDAARAADGAAECAAEREREYQEAWRAGRDWAELGHDIGEARRAALALIREVKQGAGRLCDIGPAVAAAVRRQMESALETVKDLKRDRAEIWQQWEGMAPRVYEYGPNAGSRSGQTFTTGCPELWAAFQDGAGSR